MTETATIHTIAVSPEARLQMLAASLAGNLSAIRTYTTNATRHAKQAGAAGSAAIQRAKLDQLYADLDELASSATKAKHQTSQLRKALDPEANP